MSGDIENRLYERFQLIVNGPALFNAIVSASELGIFERLSKTKGSNFEDLVKTTGLKPHKLRVLLLALCSTELVSKYGENYINSSLADNFLGSGGDDSWRHILLSWQQIFYPAFARMTDALRAGTNTALDQYPGTGATIYERLSNDPAVEKILHRSMAAFTLRSMSGLVDNIDLSKSARLLDIGGGDGTTARAIVERFPHLRVTIFDLPSVVKIANDEALSTDSRVDSVSGDFFRDPFPGGADAILFSHVLEVFDEEKITFLLSAAHAALPVGGRVFIYEFNASDDETSGVLGARLSLYLNILATGRGMAYPACDYERWLRTAGFAEVRTMPDLPLEHGLTIGIKHR
jgi:SAM-dependent methyltransferase